MTEVFRNRKDTEDVLDRKGLRGTSGNRILKKLGVVFRREKERVKYIHMHLQSKKRNSKKKKYMEILATRYSGDTILAVPHFNFKGEKLR